MTWCEYFTLQAAKKCIRGLNDCAENLGFGIRFDPGRRRRFSPFSLREKVPEGRMREWQ
jgi:hypothetical protein